MSKKDLRLYASRANQWARCSGILNLEENSNPIENANKAELGTILHKIAERIINDVNLLSKLNYHQIESRANEFIENSLSSTEQLAIDSIDFHDVIKYTKFYINVLYEDCTYNNPDEILIEKKFIEKIAPKVSIIAKIDLATLYYNKSKNLYHITVYDYKTGRAEVEAQENLQLAIALHLIVENLKLEKKDLILQGVIIQPPIQQIKRASFTYRKSFLKNLYKPKTKRRFVTGSQCTYCDYNDICPELKKKIKKYLNPKFQDITVERPKEWSELLKIQKPLTKMLDSVKNAAVDFAFKGVEIPGYELSSKSGHRFWIQSASINRISKKLKLTSAEIVKPKEVKSVAQVEKLLRQDASPNLEHLPDLCYQPEFKILKRVKE